MALHPDQSHFRSKRGDTRVSTIEALYRINLHTRADTLLSNLLEDRGFDSLSQLLKAYRGNLNYHPRKRRIFLSFRAEDKPQVQGFRLMTHNEHVDLDFYDASLTAPIGSAHAPYIKSVLKERIARASVVVCLIGNGTAWRDWVDWEIKTAYELRKGVCGILSPVRLRSGRAAAHCGTLDSSV